VRKLPPDLQQEVYNPSEDGPVEDMELKIIPEPGEPDVPEIEVDV